MSLLSAYRESRAARAMKNVRDAYDAAAREHARLDGEVRRLNVLLGHYNSLIAVTVPRHAWHRYAELQDCRVAVEAELARVSTAQVEAHNSLAHHTASYMENYHG